MAIRLKRTLTSYQKTAAVVWAASGLLFGAGFFGMYLPQHSALAKLQKQYEESQEKAGLAKKAADEQTRRQLDEQTRQTLAQLNAFTIPADRVSNLVFEVGRIAGQLNLSGFSSKSLSVQTSEKNTDKQPVSEAWLSVEFEGAYEQFARFMNLLERNSPAIFVEKVFVHRSTKSNEQCSFQMELSILMSNGMDRPGAAVAKAE